MEKRVRGVPLRSVFVRYLLLSGGICLTLAVLWFLLLEMLVNLGFIYLANAGSQAWLDAANLVPGWTADTFDPDALPQPMRYVLYEGPAPGQIGAGEGEPWVLSTNLSEKQLAAWGAGQRVKESLYTTYEGSAQLADGTWFTCFYAYTLVYVNPALRGVWPDFQLLWLGALAAACLLAVGLVTRHYARLLRRDAQLLADAGARIAAGDVSAAAAARPRVREFGDALATMDTLREELARSLKAQWEMEQQRTDQIAALAHDLKTPLTVIGGNAELLAEEPLTAPQKDSVEAILRSTRRAEGYVGRLRAVSAGAEDAPLETVPLPPLVEAVVGEAKGLCTPRGIVFEAGGVPHLAVPAQRQELARALLNLLDNAARYTPAGGRITLRVEADAREVAFIVEDTGPGFSPEALAKAGEALYTSDAARPQGGHQGLGLYFARQAAGRHGGRLELGNTGQGARAVLTVSRVPGEK